MSTTLRETERTSPVVQAVPPRKTTAPLAKIPARRVKSRQASMVSSGMGSKGPQLDLKQPMDQLGDRLQSLSVPGSSQNSATPKDKAQGDVHGTGSESCTSGGEYIMERAAHSTPSVAPSVTSSEAITSSKGENQSGQQNTVTQDQQGWFTYISSWRASDRPQPPSTMSTMTSTESVDGNKADLNVQPATVESDPSQNVHESETPPQTATEQVEVEAGWTAYLKSMLGRDPSTDTQVVGQTLPKLDTPLANETDNLQKDSTEETSVTSAPSVEEPVTSSTTHTDPRGSRWWFSSRTVSRDQPVSNPTSVQGPTAADPTAKHEETPSVPAAGDTLSNPSDFTPQTQLPKKRTSRVLPTWDDTFLRLPRASKASSLDVPPITTQQLSPQQSQVSPSDSGHGMSGSSAWQSLLAGYRRMSSTDESHPVSSPPKTPSGTDHQTRTAPGIKTELPSVDKVGKECWKNVKRVVVIGVHGWFPNSHVQR